MPAEMVGHDKTIMPVAAPPIASRQNWSSVMFKIIQRSLLSSNAIFYPRHMALTNTILQRNILMRIRAFSDLLDLCIRKSAVPMIRSIMMATFTACVGVIFSFCSYLQMLWINAWRIVASVHDDFAFRNRPFEKLVRVAMRPYWTLSRHQNNAIAISVFCPRPEPASIGFLNSIQKNILRAKNWIFLKIARIPFFGVTRSAQFAGNGSAAPAFYAGNGFSNLIGHGAS